MVASLKLRQIFIITCLGLLFVAASSTVVAVLAAADSQSGHAAFKAGDYQKALSRWTELGGKGDALAQYNLALMYLKGVGVAKDYARAVHWLVNAANGGVAPASVNLGMIFENGSGVAKDLQRAFVFLTVGVTGLGTGRCRDIAEERRKAIQAQLTPKEVADAVRSAALLSTPPTSVQQDDCFDSIVYSPVQFRQLQQVAKLAEIARQPAVLPDVASAGEKSVSNETTQAKTTASTYLVQVGALPTDDAARREEQRLKKRFGDLLEGRRMFVQKATLAGLGVVYRVRIGSLRDANSAKLLCTQLQKSAQACFVIRGIESAPRSP